MGLIYTHQKSKKPKKLNAKQRELQADWEALLKKYPPLQAKRVVREKQVVQAPVEVLKAKYDTTVAAKTAPKVYTGDKIVGIATMHKSNLVPIFNEQAAKDVASMRR